MSNLLRISTPRTFEQGEFICREGEPGDKMYVVLQGSVDVYINTLMEGSVLISRVAPGNLFCEMSPFDNLPRSASCVAHSKTVCVAISKNMLPKFITLCPDFAEKLIVNLSMRVRELNSKLYKVKATPIARETLKVFSVPDGHKSVDYFSERVNPRYIDFKQSACPVCDKPVNTEFVREHELTVKRVLPNQRLIYQEGEVAWHKIWYCPHCGYANYYINFFQMQDYDRSDVLWVVNNQNQYRKNVFIPQSEFDQLAFLYYQAIHFNECFNSSATLLLGKLWETLYWMYSDARLAEMKSYCRERAVDYYRRTFLDHSEQLTTVKAKQKCAYIIGELSLEMDRPKDARAFFSKAAEFSNPALQDRAFTRIRQLREGQIG